MHMSFAYKAGLFFVAKFMGENSVSAGKGIKNTHPHAFSSKNHAIKMQ